MGKLYLVAAIGALLGLVVGGAYLYGKQSGRTTQLERSIAAEKDRKGIDRDTQRLDDFNLCVRVGGLPDDCEQLRGVDPSTQAQ